MIYRIVQITEQHIPGFRETADVVFRESLMFTFLEAPSIESVTEFVLGNIKNNNPHFVAIIDDTVVGWCDILVKQRPTMRHSGVLGVGVLKSHRQKGIGTALIEAALQAARARGLNRVELLVRTDNVPAKKLYEKIGFVVEGVLRKHLLVRGVHKDSYQMALLYE